MSETVRATRMILQERKRQDDKWGQQDHDLGVWMEILTEELGEMSKENLALRFADPDMHDELKKVIRADRLKEAVHAAAVMHAIVEYLVRQEDRIDRGEPIFTAL